MGTNVAMATEDVFIMKRLSQVRCDVCCSVRPICSCIGDKDKMADQVETFRENATLLINQAFEQFHQAIEEGKEDTVVRDGGHFTFQDNSSVPPEGTVSEDTR